MTSSAASSEDFEFRGMWFRMWSSISSPMRLLMAPRAAARRCSTSAHRSSSLSPRRALSSWPMTFLVRVTRSSFSREVCDIFVVYPNGVWYQATAAKTTTKLSGEKGPAGKNSVPGGERSSPEDVRQCRKEQVLLTHDTGMLNIVYKIGLACLTTSSNG